MKSAKKVCLLLAIAMLVIFALAVCACEDKAEEFVYKKVEVSTGMSTTDDMLERIFDNMYKACTLSVTNKTITLKTQSAENKMEYKKEGDKYLLLGEDAKVMTDALNQSVAGQGVTVDSVEYFAEKIDNGWNLVIIEKMSAQGIKVTMNIRISFEKAAKAA